MRLFNKRLFAGLALSSMLVLSACGTEAATTAEAEVDLNALTLSEIETQAKEEGHVESVGMPGYMGELGRDLGRLSYRADACRYGHEFSGRIGFIQSRTEYPTKDIGDVGQSFGPVAEADGLTLLTKHPIGMIFRSGPRMMMAIGSSVITEHWLSSPILKK